ncbi:copper amine oxidase N-terminal domain-containing protein [Defluviitalea phaphyphila]|uniref:copper amine oxidase N-terminal domain-containing protein n=1 Tax=Defluviitalea phaphyphila TaxID=1473580 RepID=UPI000731BDE7|nr:copper amine oxidase N-terminal domain-containing protein [Defluviitalea phaphyphila]
MKKIFMTILMIGIFFMGYKPLFAKEVPSLFINGVERNDVTIVVEDNTILMPLEICSEELKAEVIWDSDIRQATVIKGDNTLIFRIDDLTYTHNGEEKKLLKEPEIINGVIYIPVKSFVEALDGVVLYDEEYNFINIYDKESMRYKVYQALKSDNLTTKRFAMLESPRLGGLKAKGDKLFLKYIFPTNKLDENYFFEYIEYNPDSNDDWVRFHIMNYYTIKNGVAVCTWSREVDEDGSIREIELDSLRGIAILNDNQNHILLKLIGDNSFDKKVKVGEWPNIKDKNFLIFEQEFEEESIESTCFYLNYNTYIRLDLDEEVVREIYWNPNVPIYKEKYSVEKAYTPFSSKNITLFTLDEKTLVEENPDEMAEY